MSILLQEGLPEEYHGVPLYTDFRNMIRAEAAMRDPELPDNFKAATLIALLFAKAPADIAEAIAGFWWFFLRGKTESTNRAKKAHATGAVSDAKAFCFTQDAEMIYSAFYEVYGINLNAIEYLHWWEFMALFEGLPEKTLIKKVMYWRTADLSKIKSKDEKAHVQKMREVFEITTQEAPFRSETRDAEWYKRQEESIKRRLAEDAARKGTVI